MKGFALWGNIGFTLCVFLVAFGQIFALGTLNIEICPTSQYISVKENTKYFNITQKLFGFDRKTKCNYR